MSTSVYGRPSSRTPAQKAALASLMRCSKAAKRLANVSETPSASSTSSAAEEAEDLPWELKAAFSPLATVTSLAREVNRDRKWVRQAILSVAHCWLLAQNEELERIKKELEHQQLTAFCESLSWDEAKQTIVCDALRLRGSRSDCKASWNVMVQERIAQWSVDSEEHLGHVSSFTYIVPPVILVGVMNSDCFFESLFRLEVLTPWRRFCEFMRQKAKLSFLVRESDDDSRNRRIMLWEAGKAANASGKPDLHCWSTCLVHGNTKLVGTIVETSCTKVLDGLFSYMKLLRMGCYWLRTVMAVTATIDELLVVVHSPPPDATRAKRQALRELFLAPTMAGAESCSFGDEFHTMCNGSWSDRVVHFCYPGNGCNCLDRKDAVRRYASAVLGVLYSKRPSVPQLAEWSSCLEPLRFLAIGIATHQLHRVIYERSVKSAPKAAHERGSDMHLVPAPTLASEKQQSAVDAGHFQDDMGWSALVGKRVAFVRQHCFARQNNAIVVLMAAMVQSVEGVNFALFKGASLEVRRMPLLYDLATLRFNPAIPAAQFLASVLTGKHALLELVCSVQGCNGVASLLARHRDLGVTLRKMLCKTAAALQARILNRGTTYPWKLARGADPRVPLEERAELFEELVNSCSGCLDPDFTQVLLKQVHCVEDFLSSGVQTAIRLWAGSVRGSTHHIEICHASQKAQTTHLSKWELLAARAVTARARKLAISLIRRSTDTTSRLPAAAATAAEAMQTPRKGHRSDPYKSGLHLFHSVCAKREALLQQSVSPVTKDFWKGVKEEWNDLTPEKQQDYNMQAKSCHRKAFDASKGQGLPATMTPEPPGLVTLDQARLPATTSDLAMRAGGVADPLGAMPPVRDAGEATISPMTPAVYRRFGQCHCSCDSRPKHWLEFDAGEDDGAFAAPQKGRRLDLQAAAFKKKVGSLCKAQGRLPSQLASRWPQCRQACARLPEHIQKLARPLRTQLMKFASRNSDAFGACLRMSAFDGPTDELLQQETKLVIDKYGPNTAGVAMSTLQLCRLNRLADGDGDWCELALSERIEPADGLHATVQHPCGRLDLLSLDEWLSQFLRRVGDAALTSESVVEVALMEVQWSSDVLHRLQILKALETSRPSFDKPRGKRLLAESDEEPDWSTAFAPKRRRAQKEAGSRSAPPLASAGRTSRARVLTENPPAADSDNDADLDAHFDVDDGDDDDDRDSIAADGVVCEVLGDLLPGADDDLPGVSSEEEDACKDDVLDKAWIAELVEDGACRAPDAPRAAVAAAPRVDGDRAERGERSFSWGPWTLAPLFSQGVATGYTAYCGLHSNRDDKLPCRRHMTFGTSQKISPEACRCKLKKWLLDGWKIGDGPTSRQEHMSVNARSLPVEDEASLDAQANALVF